MKKTIYIVIAFIVVAIAVVGYLRFVVGGDEDTWICENGAWVKHGNPDAAKPTTAKWWLPDFLTSGNRTKEASGRSSIIILRSNPNKQLNKSNPLNRARGFGAGDNIKIIVPG